MDGWPGLQCFSFPLRNCGCPVLAFLARAGPMLPVRWVLSCPAACIAPMALIICTLSPARVTGGCLFCAPRAAATVSVRLSPSGQWDSGESFFRRGHFGYVSTWSGDGHFPASYRWDHE